MPFDDWLNTYTLLTEHRVFGANFGRLASSAMVRSIAADTRAAAAGLSFSM